MANPSSKYTNNLNLEKFYEGDLIDNDAINNNYDKIDISIKSLQTLIGNIQNSILSQNNTISSLNNIINSHSTSISNNKDQINLNIDNIQSLSNELTPIKNEISNLETNQLKYACGSYTMTNSTQYITLGFLPIFVIIIAIGGSYYSTSTNYIFHSGYFFNTTKNSTYFNEAFYPEYASTSFATNYEPSPTEHGFSLKTNGIMNNPASQFTTTAYYMAWGI